MLRRFKPAWWSVLLSLVCICLFMRLGVWQWERGDEKSALLKWEHAKKPVFQLTRHSKVKAGELIAVSGTFDNQHTFLLDNQFYHHQIGFDVITPIKLSNGQWLLVDLGWINANPDRRLLPKVRLLDGVKHFQGSAYFPSSKSRVLNSRLDNEGAWPLIIEKLDTRTLDARLGVNFYPFILRLDKHAAFGYQRDWQVVSMLPERHYGYAAQWFSFAFIVLLLFVYLNVEKKRGS